jgi:hypothetical protein
MVPGWRGGPRGPLRQRGGRGELRRLLRLPHDTRGSVPGRPAAPAAGARAGDDTRAGQGRNASKGSWLPLAVRSVSLHVCLLFRHAGMRTRNTSRGRSRPSPTATQASPALRYSSIQCGSSSSAPSRTASTMDETPRASPPFGRTFTPLW